MSNLPIQMIQCDLFVCSYSLLYHATKVYFSDAIRSIITAAPASCEVIEDWVNVYHLSARHARC